MFIIINYVTIYFEPLRRQKSFLPWECKIRFFEPLKYKLIDLDTHYLYTV